MPHDPTILHAAELHAATPRAKSVYGILPAVTLAAVIAILLTAEILSRSPAAADEHRGVVTPAAPMAMVESPGTSVPEASTVFDGKDTPEEERAPTF